MEHFEITKHANLRFAQRAISISDAEMIIGFGTEVDDGYIFLNQNCDALESELKAAIQRVRKLRGQRIVIGNGQVITAYRATAATTRKLIRHSEKRQQEI